MSEHGLDRGRPMSAEMSAETLAGHPANHVPVAVGPVTECRYCEARWPCDAIRLLDALAEQTRRADDLAAKVAAVEALLGRERERAYDRGREDHRAHACCVGRTTEAQVEVGAQALFEHFHGTESQERYVQLYEWPPPEQHLPWWRNAARAVLRAALTSGGTDA